MAVNVMAAAVPLLLALSSYLMHPLAGVIGTRPYELSWRDSAACAAMSCLRP